MFTAEINLMALVERFGGDHGEDNAREFLERLRWPNGPVCPRCGGADPYRLMPKAESKTPGRKGLLKCRACRKQFTVTVGTIMEDSHIALAKWAMAFHLICSSKKGMSAHQLHRMLGMTYRAAWFMAHRIRYAMTQEPLAGKLKGEVEVDETYIGGKISNQHGRRGTGRGTDNKVPVVALVERGGRVRAQVSPKVTADALRTIIKKNIEPGSRIMTDQWGAYKTALRGDKDFAKKHYTVNHAKGEYVRGIAGTNTIEGFFSILKRGIYGVFHHVSERHLNRYLDEFCFRYDRRGVSDGERTVQAIQAAAGKRLMFREPLL